MTTTSYQQTPSVSTPPYRYPEAFGERTPRLGYQTTVPIEFLLDDEENKVAYAIGLMAWTCWHNQSTPLPRFTRVVIVGPDRYYRGERGYIVGYANGLYQVRLELDWRTNAPTMFGADEVQQEVVA